MNITNRFDRASLIYRVPDPLETFEAARKFEHLDLRDLGDLALWQEQKRVEDAIAHASGDRPSDQRHWLLERLARVRFERTARGTL